MVLEVAMSHLGKVGNGCQSVQWDGAGLSADGLTHHQLLKTGMGNWIALNLGKMGVETFLTAHASVFWHWIWHVRRLSDKIGLHDIQPADDSSAVALSLAANDRARVPPEGY